MSAEPAQTDASEARRQAILAAAFEAFRRYGFRRASMEDIARAADLSRAALYLYYRNKTDIFRSLAEQYFIRTQEHVQSALKPAMPVGQVLAAVFAAKAGPEMEAMFESPHGEELLDANFSVCGDIVQRGEEQIAQLLADWLTAEARVGRITLDAGAGDAGALARVMIAALIGPKTVETSFAAYRESCARLAALFARGLTP